MKVILTRSLTRQTVGSTTTVSQQITRLVASKIEEVTDNNIKYYEITHVVNEQQAVSRYAVNDYNILIQRSVIV